MPIQTVLRKIGFAGLAFLALPSLLTAGNTAYGKTYTNTAPVQSTVADADTGATLAPVLASADLSRLPVVSLADAPQAASATKTLSVKFKAPVFAAKITGTTALSKLYSPFSLEKGALLQVTSQSGEQLYGKNANGEEVWTPSWYTTAEAGSAAALSPLLLHSVSTAKLFLFPGSSIKWTIGSSLAMAGGKPGEWLAVAKWRDWYGVLAKPAAWHDKYTVYQPVILWINAKDILTAPVKKTVQPVFDAGSPLSTPQIQMLTEAVLAAGSGSSTVKQLLGEPQYTEDSANLNGQDTNKPLVLGQTWRYEREDGQFTVSFNGNGKLAAWKWILPTTGDTMLNVLSAKDYHFSYDFRREPLPSTLTTSSLWQNHGNLGYTYLVGGNDQTLLLKGDDGGYSGMFENSSLYAVDLATGSKLWQIDGGFGIMTAILDVESGEVTVYNDYNKETRSYEAQVRRIRLSDGKVLWTCKLPEGQNAQIAAAGPIIAVGDLNGPSGPTLLTALDAATGMVKWKKTLTDENYLLLNQGAGDPYLLLQQGLTLTALEPETGEAVWYIQGYGKQAENPDRNPYFAGVNRISPLVEQTPERWMLIGSSWYLMDLESGTSLAVYPANPGEQFEALQDPRYLLIERPSESTDSANGSDLLSSEGTKSVYYDTAGERELWKLPGKADHAIADNGTIYLMLDGRPAAVAEMSGQILWEAESAAQSAGAIAQTQLSDSGFVLLGSFLLIEYGPDLLVLNKQDGSLMGRLSNVTAGYAELREKIARSGLLGLYGDSLYAGSANGIFTRYDVDALYSQLTQLGSR